jgi:hypothetical protein
MRRVSTNEHDGEGRTDRWQSLVTGAFLLEESLKATPSPRGDTRPPGALAVSYLDSVLEVFPSSVDPVEDFEGYAIRRMALALRRALEESGR